MDVSLPYVMLEEAMLRKFRFKRYYKGSTIIEYTLIVSMLVLACYGGYKKAGKGYGNIYKSISTALENINSD